MRITKEMWICISCLFLFIACNNQSVTEDSWHSSLYPENWTPGYTDTAGRFLHDFSYAGYHSGLKEFPTITNNIIDITKAPYNAKSNGTDVTAIIQRAVNDVEKAGGGVVFLPEGEYTISVKDRTGIRISQDNVVLRGAGSGKTFLKNKTNSMRGKSVVLFAPESGSWYEPISEPVKLTKDTTTPTQTIEITDVSKFKPGDLIVLYADVTNNFIREHNMLGLWSTVLRGPTFFRTVTAVNPQNKTIVIDAPTRYPLKLRDNARVYHVSKQLIECGIEGMSIGNVMSFAPGDGYSEDEYTQEGTMGHETHGSHFIEFRNAVNCWARNVSSYRPEENMATKDTIHFLSNALRIYESRFVTVKNVELGFSQYEGGGGNGYMFTLEGNDCLLEECLAIHSRHNYDFKRMCSNGNVIYNCTGRDARLASDFHMHLSMANLIDNFISDADFWDATFRPWGGFTNMHGYSTTQSVFWNTQSIREHPKNKFLIDSKQLGWGYVIGTSGVMTKVITAPAAGQKSGLAYYTLPEDFVEGEGKGETLTPKSLYQDQLEKRKQRN